MFTGIIEEIGTIKSIKTDKIIDSYNSGKKSSGKNKNR
jgi:riboflavin synthase alpha subunit